MQSISRESLASNAYRTLGLSASAGQAAVEAAARRMRIWPDARLIPATPWDLPRLGTVSRARGDIEQAVARLNDPAVRVRERMTWYAGGHPPTPAHPAEPGAPGSAAAMAARHDTAVAALHAAVIVDPLAADMARWRRVMERFTELAGSTAYAAWLAELEQAGEFEKRASRAEVEAAAASMPAVLAATLIPKAEAALDRNDAATSAGIIGILRAAQAADPRAAWVDGLLDRLEDTITARCGEMEGELRDKLGTNRTDPQPFYAENHATSEQAARFYSSQVVPLLSQFNELAADDPARFTRVRSACAEVLELLALGWEWAGQFITAEETLVLARGLAEGSALAVSIDKALERIRPLAAEERRMRTWNVGHVMPLPAGDERQRQVYALESFASGTSDAEDEPDAPEPSRRRPPIPVHAPADGTSSFGVPWWAVGLLILLISGFVRSVLTDSGGGGRGSSRPPNDYEYLNSEFNQLARRYGQTQPAIGLPAGLPEEVGSPPRDNRLPPELQPRPPAVADALQPKPAEAEAAREAAERIADSFAETSREP